MAFVERFTSVKSTVPFRCYTDENEFKEVFGTVEKAREYASSIVKKHRELFRDRTYLLMTAYGFEKKKIAEVFGYKVMDKWPGNAEVLACVFENGKFLPSERSSCENMDIVRGKEGEHRRKTVSLDEFLKSVPNLGNLQPLKEGGIID